MFVRLLGVLFAGSLVLAACGGDSSSDEATTASSEESPAAEAAEPVGGDVADEAPAADDEAADDEAADDEAADDEAMDDEAMDDEAMDNPVSVATTALGETLVDTDGLTLYAFTNDTDAASQCNDACADAWPPLIVAGPDELGDLDREIFSLTTRPDSSLQVVANGQPIYRFAGDAAPGDTMGHGVGDVWFAVAADGSLIDA